MTEPDSIEPIPAGHAERVRLKRELCRRRQQLLDEGDPQDQAQIEKLRRTIDTLSDLLAQPPPQKG